MDARSNKTLYFAFENVLASFSVYGNDVTWYGVVVDEDNNIVNNSLTIATCEMGTDIGELICEADEEGEIFNEDGDVINQQHYDEMAETFKEDVLAWYWEMDEEVADHITIDGVDYIRILPEAFCERHQLGEVNRFFRDTLPDNLNTKKGLDSLEDACPYGIVSLGKWSKRVIHLEEYEMDECGDDCSQGWLRFDDGREIYVLFQGKDEKSIAETISQMEEQHISLQELTERYPIQYHELFPDIPIITL